MGGLQTNVGTLTAENAGFYGYTNTNTIKAYAINNEKNLQTDFPATYWATEGYEDLYPAPDKSSGWFLPSAGQGKYWLDNSGAILAGVRKATGKSDYKWKDWYWSSSEYDNGPANYAWLVHFYSGDVYFGSKNYGDAVRGVFAF